MISYESATTEFSVILFWYKLPFYKKVRKQKTGNREAVLGNTSPLILWTIFHLTLNSAWNTKHWYNDWKNWYTKTKPWFKTKKQKGQAKYDKYLDIRNSLCSFTSEYIKEQMHQEENASIKCNYLIFCIGTLSLPYRTLYCMAANWYASSIVHLWYPRNNFGSSCENSMKMVGI